MLALSKSKNRGWEEPILSLILAAIHCLCDMFTRLYVQFQIYRRLFQIKDTKADFKNIRHLSQHGQLSKIPQHIALAFLEAELDLSQVASLILWSVASGCQYLSLYDFKGLLKNQRIELIAQLTLLSHHLDPSDNFQLQWSTEDNNHLKGNGLGSSSSRCVQICLLSQEDGQADIVRSAQVLASMSNAVISEEAIEAQLNRLKVDPDLLVRFGLARSNCGYPPWQIRLSEIHDLDSHFCCPRQFVQVLFRYSQCHQRFGH